VHLSWVADLGGWRDETDFHETRDTGFLLARLDQLWHRVPGYKPLRACPEITESTFERVKYGFTTRRSIPYVVV